LVKQVMRCIIHMRIKRLTKVYVRLSVAEVAADVGIAPAAVEVEVLRMVRACLVAVCASVP
jgi:hypothetical protein